MSAGSIQREMQSPAIMCRICKSPMPSTARRCLVCWHRDDTVKLVPQPSNEQMLLNELVTLVNACEANGFFITSPARAAIATYYSGSD